MTTHVSRILRCPLNEAGVCQDRDSYSRLLKSIAVRQIRRKGADHYSSYAEELQKTIP